MDTRESKAGAPVPLTEAETEQVCGGLATIDFRPVGCLTCTSGGDLRLFDRWREVINPATPTLTGAVPVTRNF